MREFTTSFNEDLAKNLLSFAEKHSKSTAEVIQDAVESYIYFGDELPGNIDELIAQGEKGPFTKVDDSFWKRLKKQILESGNNGDNNFSSR